MTEGGSFLKLKEKVFSVIKFLAAPGELILLTTISIAETMLSDNFKNSGCK